MKRIQAITLVAAMFALVLTAAAKDSALATVVPVSGPSPIITANGSATGTIHVIYTVSAFNFTPGNFASATVEIDRAVGTSGQPTTYPLDLLLEQKQQGDTNLELTIDPGTHNLTSAWSQVSSSVNIAIPNTTLPSDDGATLVGVLQIDGGSKLNTVTTILFKIILLHPTSCLRFYNFMTYEDGSGAHLSLSEINVQFYKFGVYTKEMQPGNAFQNLLVLNTCTDTHTMDLKSLLDPAFEVGGGTNPVQFYTSANTVTEGTFDFSLFGSQTPNGTSLCVQNRSVAPGTSILAQVKTAIKECLAASSLPAASTGFSFTGSVHTAGSTCDAGSLHGVASPNTDTDFLTYTTSSVGTAASCGTTTSTRGR